MTRALGLDSSHWTDPDWPDWASRGYVFTYLKATEGTTWKDPMYISHNANAQDAKFITGPYHFFRVQYNGATQAEHFFAVAGATSLPPVVDVEFRNNRGYSKAVFAARLRNFLLRAEELFGRKPMIYTSRYMWHELVGSASWSRQYDLWVANYTTRAEPVMPNDWDEWKMWQFIDRPIDQNRFNGNELELRAWAQLLPPPDTVTVEFPVDTYNALKGLLCEQ